MKKIIFIICTVLILIFICIVFIFNLFGFSSQSPQLVPQSVIIYSESMTEYDKFENLNSLRGSTIRELSDQYDIDYYKYDPALGFYTILKTDKGILILQFDWTLKFSGYIIQDINTDINIYNQSDVFIFGTSVEAVMKLDPSGSYPFLFSGRTDYPKISYHCFSNGSGYVVTYDDEHYINSINRFTI